MSAPPPQSALLWQLAFGVSWQMPSSAGMRVTTSGPPSATSGRKSANSVAQRPPPAQLESLVQTVFGGALPPRQTGPHSVPPQSSLVTQALPAFGPVLQAPRPRAMRRIV